MKEDPVESPVERNHAEFLRGFVTERLAAVSREILGAVEAVVSGYEEEASGFRLEIRRQRNQLELLRNQLDQPQNQLQNQLRNQLDQPRNQLQNQLQNQLTVGTNDLPSSKSDGSAEEEEGDDCLKSQTQTASSSSDGRSPGRFQVSEAQSAIHLSIRVLKDSSISILSKTVVKKCPLVSLKCPLGLQELDFLSLLRSAVPQLAADDKPFHIWTLDKRRRLQRLTLSTVTPEEIVRNVKSTRLRKPTVYIRLKTKKEIQEEIPSLQMEKSSAMLVSEEMRKSSQQHRRETEDDPLMTSVSGDDSTAPPAAQMDGDAADGNEGETNRSNSSWKLDVSDEREKQNPKLMNEKEEVNPSEDVWTETGFSCKVCKTAQKSEVAVIKHTWRHMEETGSVCGVCGESGEASKNRFHSEHRTDDSQETAIPGQLSLSLSDPLKVHSGQQPVQPEVSSFVSGLPLENKHKLRHECPTCHELFEVETQLKAHHRTHRKRKTYLCGVCGKFLSSNRSLSRHKMTHSGERPHRCQICERGFKLATTLKQHEKIHMNRERPYLCDVCCKMFLTSKQLVIHMRTHTNEKPYRCERCGKGFTTRGPLTIHMRVHTGETPYRCPHCGWSFKRKTHLDDHVAIHTGAKPYVCGICGKTCARRTYLTVHMRTHNGEKPYKCSLCEKAFTQSHCLKTHMKSHKAAQAAS
ncbi:zinc finger protein 436-like [Poeciliopsis prolifica]|uniref:zinc finger protein 436-like n=1 Tax=Poeciliopsis prolifica TaxID=188132 RepID=UPI002413DFBB|nr:zinc finger protein 436-like [Poeciliopsis prolifica]